jgi:hypothetical protein
MKPSEKNTDVQANAVFAPEERKSKITLYWEKRERLGAKGEIVNMRSVLK